MENNTNEPRKGFNTNIIYIGIIAVLAAVSIYLFVTKNKTENQNEELTTQVETTTTDLGELETEYNAALARLDEMKSESVQMDSLLNSKNDEVESLKSRIKTILSDKNATKSQLAEANKLINELKTKMNSYQEQITALKQENVQLTEDKKNLIEEKNQVIDEKNALTEDKKVLEKTVEVGSVLHASGIKMDVINMKKNILGQEKEKGTEKARKADLIRISFDLDDNRISESGEKIIYVCVYGPDGKVAGNSSFKMVDGSEKKYSVAKTVPYKQGEKVHGVSTEWKPISDFTRGNYKVEIYHMGYKIGGENVTLK
jgi:predicted nuclease with TOPRIM domain